MPGGQTARKQVQAKPILFFSFHLSFYLLSSYVYYGDGITAGSHEDSKKQV